MNFYLNISSETYFLSMGPGDIIVSYSAEPLIIRAQLPSLSPPPFFTVSVGILVREAVNYNSADCGSKN